MKLNILFKNIFDKKIINNNIYFDNLNYKDNILSCVLLLMDDLTLQNFKYEDKMIIDEVYLKNMKKKIYCDEENYIYNICEYFNINLIIYENEKNIINVIDELNFLKNNIILLKNNNIINIIGFDGIEEKILLLSKNDKKIFSEIQIKNKEQIINFIKKYEFEIIKNKKKLHNFRKILLICSTIKYLLKKI